MGINKETLRKMGLLITSDENTELSIDQLNPLHLSIIQNHMHVLTYFIEDLGVSV